MRRQYKLTVTELAVTSKLARRQYKLTVTELAVTSKSSRPVRRQYKLNSNRVSSYQ